MQYYLLFVIQGLQGSRGITGLPGPKGETVSICSTTINNPPLHLSEKDPSLLFTRAYRAWTAVRVFLGCQEERLRIDCTVSR